MGLPSIIRPRKRNSGSEKYASTGPSTPVSNDYRNNSTSKETIRAATKTRRIFALTATFAYIVSWIFLVLVMIGNTYPKAVLDSIYFFKLDLADIIPMSIPNASLINSIAQSIGLHDFYQVGLWNFCEGYIYQGITYCSPPQRLYWFNPVEIIMSELLAGATIALPTEILTILSVLRITSQIMFGFFLTGAVLTFILIFLSPLATRSKWWSLPLAITSFINMVLVGAASIVGTVISLVFKYAAEAQKDLNIHASVGVKMFVFMWLATGFSIYGFAVHSGMGCCCASRRDLRTGRRTVKGGQVQPREIDIGDNRH
ncbi:SUR7/PalI family-domain-containing protein [Podospora australis]|uniref:SUR7/PalI family-domain-containing protein n=1 Tax=Podospora australis TaxID=1536484 RepID=A0AAN6X3A7_9PEZI|nr:SUR7/PalI family-domain-containing protein [Podospora australis]